MKKILTILLTLLMVLSLVGCAEKKQEEQPVTVDTPEVIEPVKEEETEEPTVGGFVDVEDRTLTDELKEIFYKAKEGYVGMSLEPVELYQTQVVAGTNYKFVCSGTKTTNPPIKGSYFVTVYKDLEGNCSIIDVETITESTGDVDGDLKEETAKKDPSKYNYWVVFYNPDGCELDRQAIKYGTTPVYKGEDPVYWDTEYWYNFVCWTDKQGNEIKEFKPITGNTYIYAKYEIGGSMKDLEPEPEPGPEPACLAKGTMITMVDGSRRAIETLQEGDLIRVFDHDLGKVSSARIMDYWQYEEPKSGLMILHFTNDIDVRIVTGHAFYNKEANNYVFINKDTVNSYIGKEFYNVDSDSWETLTGVTYSDEKVNTFFIATEEHYDCVAEGMLNVEDGIYHIIRSTFDFDKNMRVNKLKKYLDTMRYGLYSYEDFDFIIKEGFDLYKVAYLKVAVGKGIINEEDIELMRAVLPTYESDYVKEEYVPENVQHSAK